MQGKQNVQQQIWGIIDNDIGIKKDLLRGIINVRALADYLQETRNLRCSIDAVISAIRRYQENQDIITKDKKIFNLFKNSTIKTKNNVLCLSLHQEAPILEWFNHLKEKGKNTRVITGEHETKLFLHNSFIKEAEQFFSKEDIKNKNDSLSEISLLISEEATRTKGVLAKITGEIALNDINIEEIIVSPPEYVLYIKNKDLLKTHETLYNLGIRE